MKCRTCGGNTQQTAGRKYHYTACGLKNVYLGGVDVRRCRDCGDEEVSIPNLAGLHRALAVLLARQERRLVAEEIRFLRKSLGLSGQDFAQVIGVEPETVSRWENGAQGMEVPTERLLRVMVLGNAPRQDEYPIFSAIKNFGVRAPGKIRNVVLEKRDQVWELAA